MAPDVPIFASLDEHRGYYIYTLSNREGEVNDTDKPFFDPALMKTKKTFSEITAEALILPSFSHEKINVFISQICLKYKKRCKEVNNPDKKSEKLKDKN